MPEKLTVIVDGTATVVKAGVTVIAAIVQRKMTTRVSVRGMPRGPLCGMGICQECRVCIDGTPHRLSCQTLCLDGMRIDTEGNGAGK